MLIQGRIVWVRLLDPAGRNPKCRPAVILTLTNEIDPVGEVVVAAATSTFTKPLPPNRVELPWMNGGHPVTKLYKPCVVMCDWIQIVPVGEIEAMGGMVPQSRLIQILANLPTLRRNPPPQNT